MFNLEKQICEWIQTHILFLFMLAVTLISVLIRYSFRDMVTSDASGCLLPWYDIIKENGGIFALRSQVGDYNMLYQFLIAVFTYLPIKPLYAYKLLSCIFDYFLAAVMGMFVFSFSRKEKALKGAMAYIIVLISPMVFLNSSYWAQCDAIYTFFCIASLFFFCREKYKAAFILYGVAFTFKLQAVFLLPFFLFAYFFRKKFTILYFAFIPAVMIALSMPGIFMGRSIMEVFTIYFNQTGSYQSINVNYPTFWNLFQRYNFTSFYLTMKQPAIAITVVALACFMVIWIVKNVTMSTRHIIYMAFLLTYTCVLFLPSMHERYGYLYEILAVAVAFLQVKTLPCLIGMYIVSFAIYGNYLFMFEVDFTTLSVVNVLVYFGYVLILMKEMLLDCEEKNAGTAQVL